MRNVFLDVFSKSVLLQSLQQWQLSSGNSFALTVAKRFSSGIFNTSSGNALEHFISLTMGKCTSRGITITSIGNVLKHFIPNTWQCKKQTIVATSTTEAEYVAAANYCGQVLWIQNQMLDYGFNFMNTKIYIDNDSTICIVKNLVYHSTTKHIEIRHHFIRDPYEKKLIQVLKIHTYDNVANLMTKAFDVSRFNFLKANTGMLNFVVIAANVHENKYFGVFLEYTVHIVAAATIHGTSCVGNLVPNPSESEGENGCDVLSCFTTFSNILFDAEYEFDSVDDQSLSDEDFSEEIFSNPLFEEEIISTKVDPHHFDVESDLIKSMLNHDSSIIPSSLKIDSLLDEFTGGGDSLVQAATTAILDAQHDSSNITTKTQSKVTLNEFTPYEEGSGYIVGSEEDWTEHDIELKDHVPQTPYDLPFSGGHIPGRDEGSMILKELTDLCTTLLQKC
nr:putative ribonuclease H-like domain-containing protein [Tanacetum cinerariifolium]